MVGGGGTVEVLYELVPAGGRNVVPQTMGLFASRVLATSKVPLGRFAQRHC